MSRKITIRLLAVVCLGILLVMMTRVSFAMFLENGLDSTPHVVNGEQAPSPQEHDQSGTNDWVGHELIKGAISAAATALGAAIGAVAAGIFAYRKWLTEHLSGKWYEMIDLASTNPKFMNAEKNSKYQQVYTDDDTIRYEMFARKCVAFVDHMVNTSRRDLEDMYRGTGRLLVGPHEAWVRDHISDYNQPFQEWFANKFPHRSARL
jgi:hypothetical protein